jgi:hypothetical protein
VLVFMVPRRDAGSLAEQAGHDSVTDTVVPAGTEVPALTS